MSAARPADRPKPQARVGASAAPRTGTPLVFITGASSGIGQALAERFHRSGYRLALVARRVAALEAWTRELNDPLSCKAYGADVREPASIAAAAHDCMTAQGLPDIVIANAGISIGVDTARAEDLDVMRAIFETNMLGLAATFQPFVGPMTARQSGVLVGVASVAGIRGLPGHGGYCSSKAAAISYLESLRGELRSSGVRVVTLAPGYVDTPLTRRNRHSMPFLMAPQAFADRAYADIASGRSYAVIPWQMGVVAKLMRVLPNSWFDRLAAGRARKPRLEE